MLRLLTLCLVSMTLTLTPTEAETIVIPPEDCECTCVCEEPELDCVTPTPPCVPTSLCQNFVNAQSEFSLKCAGNLDPTIVSQMYEDCLKWEAESQEELEDFIENIIAICEQKGASVQIEGGDCVTESTTTESVTTPSESTTTECVPISKCDNLRSGADSDFNSKCAPLLAPEIVTQMQKDCDMWQADSDEAVDDFCDNVKAICASKGVEIECPEIPCPTPPVITTPECIPLSKCDNLRSGVESDFNEKCAPLLAPEIVTQMQKDCDMWQADSDEAVDDFCDNVKAICASKGVEIECPEIPCPTTVTTPTTTMTTTEPQYTVTYDNCTCTCVCTGQPPTPPECTTTTTTTLTTSSSSSSSTSTTKTTTKTTTITTQTTTFSTTTCIPSDPCDALIVGDFPEKCEDLLAARIVAQMKKDCQDLNGDLDAIRDLFDNIELLCEEKGVEGISIEITNDCVTTSPITPTPTTCIPSDPCDALTVGDFPEKCEDLLAARIVAQMKKDCQDLNGDLDAIRDLFDNIELLCEEKGVEGISIEITNDCVTTSPITPTPTTCIPSDPCDALTVGDFPEKCEDLLAARIVAQMKKDCQDLNGDLDAIRDLFDNIELLCEEKGVEGISIEITNDCVTTSPITATPTTCIPSDPCDALTVGDFPEICEEMLAPEIAARMKQDCKDLEGDLEAIRDLFDNIVAVCESKGVSITIDIPPDPCETSTSIMTSTTPCVATNVVFMIDGSNSMGRTDFEQEIRFLKDILNTIPYDENPCLHIALLSFSQSVKVKYELTDPVNLEALLDKTDSLIFEASVTNTHLAFDTAKSLFQSADPTSNNVVVLITDGMSTDWKATLQSMIELYDAYPQAKTVVVAVEDPDMDDMPRPDQVRAMATGVEEENLIEVGDFAELTQDKATDVVNMIFSDAPEACKQWAFTDLPEGQIGSAILGVFEPVAALGECNGKPVYRNTNNAMWLGMHYITVQGSPFLTWVLADAEPLENCVPQALIAAMPVSESPTPQGEWKTGANDLPVTVSCFN